MGDLVLTSAEVKPVLAELARQRIAVTRDSQPLVEKIRRSHMSTSTRRVNPVELAGRLDRVSRMTGAPAGDCSRPQPGRSIPHSCSIRSDFTAGRRAQSRKFLSCWFGTVTFHGRTVTPALGYGTPINIKS